MRFLSRKVGLEDIWFTLYGLNLDQARVAKNINVTE